MKQRWTDKLKSDPKWQWGLIGGLVAVVAVIIAAFFLFRIDDGALKVKDGNVMTDGDNWLIVNGSNARGGVR